MIIGDVGSGKTKLTLQVIEELIRIGLGREITVIDMAPKRKGIIGGRLLDLGFDSSKVLSYFLPRHIYPPRILGKNGEEVLKYSIHNAKNIIPLLNSYIQNPSKILVINDLSIYFHAGNIEHLDLCIMLSKTFIANSYYGHILDFDFGVSITKKERALLLETLKFMDNIIVVKKVKEESVKGLPKLFL